MGKKTNLTVPVNELNMDEKYRVMYVQGERIQIAKGEEVQVNQIVKDILNESDTLRRKGNTQEINKDGSKGLILHG